MMYAQEGYNLIVSSQTNLFYMCPVVLLENWVRTLSQGKMGPVDIC